MITHVDEQADLLTVLSRLSRRYASVLNMPGSPSKEKPQVSAKVRVLFSAIGSSCE